MPAWKFMATPMLVSAVFFVATLSIPSATGTTLNGTVQTGGTCSAQPLGSVPVKLLEATNAQPRLLGQATTDTFGRFSIQSARNVSSSTFYVSADIGGGVEFVAILGTRLPATVTINELTTVAASYSTAQFYKTGVISGSSFGLQLAAGMNDNLVTPVTGESSLVLLSSPNADQSNSLRSTRSLANLLAACVNDHSITNSFLALATPPRGPAPTTTAQALADLTRNPWQNVNPIYTLTQLSDSYEPALESAPDAWTVTVKVNDTGNDAHLFAGPAGLTFDSRGYAWITNNVNQGTPFSGQFMVVLQPNGKPSDGTNGTPLSPLTGGGLLGGGYGVTIDPDGSVWVSNFGWGPPNCTFCFPTPGGNGSVSEFSASGVPLSGSNGFQGGPVRVQGMAADASGNIWIASYSTDSVYVFLGGDPNQSVFYRSYAGSQPFGIALAADGTAWVTNSGGFDGQDPRSVAKYALVNGALQQQFQHFLGQALKGLAVDSQGNAWVTSQGNSSIYALRPDGTPLGKFTGGGIDGPWGVAVDGEDNVWVANFGPLQPHSNFTSGRISELCGTNAAACPPGKRLGNPISPSSGYTVPSAGSQVLLHNGDPLYGYGPLAQPSFSPMMRLTSVVIDQAGNIWSINNWKPDIDIDVCCNPGGDGAVIFVGLAAPPHAQAH
jgi:sugar lactone lactonase YvrE